MRYRTILADPPWDTKNQHGAFAPTYPLMSLQEICSLPVATLVEDDAHLWLWVTNADIFEQVRVMQAWGFSYRSCLTWIKPRFGLGQYLRNQTEHLLLGVRGRSPMQFRSQGT